MRSQRAFVRSRRLCYTYRERLLAPLTEFFTPGVKSLVAQRTEEVVRILEEVAESMAEQIGSSARQRALAKHNAAHRVAELIALIDEAGGEKVGKPNRELESTRL